MKNASRESRDDCLQAVQMGRPFTLEVDTAACVVSLSGELDLGAADTLIATAESLLVSHDGRPLVLDMTDVDFLDSTGIGAIVQLRNEALVGGGTFKLIGLRGQPQRVVELAGLDHIFS